MDVPEPTIDSEPMRDWTGALQRIEHLRRENQLQEAQPWLTDTLRSSNNWKLTETILEAIHTLCEPDDKLLECVLAILMDDARYQETRILAADALCSMTNRIQGDDRGRTVTRALVREHFASLVAGPISRLLRDTLVALLGRLDQD